MGRLQFLDYFPHRRESSQRLTDRQEEKREEETKVGSMSKIYAAAVRPLERRFRYVLSSFEKDPLHETFCVKAGRQRVGDGSRETRWASESIADERDRVDCLRNIRDRVRRDALEPLAGHNCFCFLPSCRLSLARPCRRTFRLTYCFYVVTRF